MAARTISTVNTAPPAPVVGTVAVSLTGGSQTVHYQWRWNPNRKHFDMWVGELAIGKPINAVKNIVDLLNGLHALFVSYFDRVDSAAVCGPAGARRVTINFPSWEEVKRPVTEELVKQLNEDT
jgi:hypothetical protein